MSAETTALTVLEHQVKDLTAQLQTLTSERDEYETALAERARAERDRSAGDARGMRPASPSSKPRSATATIIDRFAELAQASNAKAKALRQLWRDAKERGYEPDGDDVDEKALQGVVAKLKADVDYAFDPEPTVAPRPPRRPPGPPREPSMASRCAGKSRPAAAGRSGTRAPTAPSSPRRCGPIPSSCSTPRTVS